MGISSIAGCGTVVYPTSALTVFTTPFVIPTRPSIPYFHYTPLRENNVHLEFDYPSYWYFNESKNPYYDQYTISLSDPLVLTLPTNDPNDSGHELENYGSIYIWIEPLPANQTLESLVQDEKEDLLGSNVDMITLLASYTVNIDGYTAYVIEILNNADVHTSTKFDRTIYFVVKDQFYRINFSISVDERGGEFEKGYEYFFNSLEIVE